jgi:ABC-type uncharacterized transport system involved in gliding motility auxiliary subunit
MDKRVMSVGSLVAVFVLFVAVNVLAGAGMSRARLDLTENRLYTLSPGSKSIARKIDEPITLTLYYSERLASAVSPAVKSFGDRVKEVLREYALASGGKIVLEIVDPDPFSDMEDRAVQAGLMGYPVGGGGRAGQDRFYFGLVGRNAVDRTETIPFFQPDREEFLEYQLTRMIYLLSDPQKKTIGVMAWLPMEGTQANPMLGRQGQTPPWQVLNQLKELFDVRMLERDVAEIPPEIRVLMLVHPKSVPDRTLFAIDQFVLKGGRVLVFVDPWCEADLPPGINPMQAMNLPRNSSLTRLMDAWGIEMMEGKFAADRANALPVNAGTQASRPEVVDHVAYLRLGPGQMDRADSITGELREMTFGIAGILRKKEGATTEFTPLVWTSTDSQPMDVQKVQFSLDPTIPRTLLAEFVPGGNRLVLAARVSGRVKTAFPDGRPGAAPKAPDPAAPTPIADEGADDAKAGLVTESAEPINVVVVSDCDMLTDRFWVREIRLSQQVLLGYDKFADNGDFVIGALDNLSGSSDLISVRARARFQRPFDKVIQIRKDAEKAYLTKEQELQTRLRETENRLAELQRERPDAGKPGGGLLLTPEQQKAIEEFTAERIRIRKELRDVQHQLRKDVERLDSRLRFLNIGLMPILVGVAAVGLSVWRAGRRRAERAAVKPLA